MEKITMIKNSKKYGFQRGDAFPVLRTIMGECVIIMPEDIPNVVISERKVNYYGVLSGKPQLG